MERADVEGAMYDVGSVEVEDMDEIEDDLVSPGPARAPWFVGAVAGRASDDVTLVEFGNRKEGSGRSRGRAGGGCKAARVVGAGK